MKQNPVNLNLFTISFPVTAIASILHRISGVLIFLSLPLLIYALQQSLASATSFAAINNYISMTSGKIVTLVLLAAVIYHVVAGIRHLLMDMHIGISKCGGKAMAALTILLSLMLIALLGMWIW